MNPELKQRLRKTERSLRFAVLLCRVFAAATLCSALIPLAPGLMEGRRLLLFFLFRPLPVALTLLAASILLCRLYLNPFLRAAATAGRTPGQPLSMRWTGKSVRGGYLAEFCDSSGAPAIRAALLLDGKPGLLWNWTKDALVFAPSGAPGEPILAATDDRIFFGRLLGQGQDRTPWSGRVAWAAALLAVLALFAFLESWYKTLSGG